MGLWLLSEVGWWGGMGRWRGPTEDSLVWLDLWNLGYYLWVESVRVELNSQTLCWFLRIAFGCEGNPLHNIGNWVSEHQNNNILFPFARYLLFSSYDIFFILLCPVLCPRRVTLYSAVSSLAFCLQVGSQSVGGISKKSEVGGELRQGFFFPISPTTSTKGHSSCPAALLHNHSLFLPF